MARVLRVTPARVGSDYRQHRQRKREKATAWGALLFVGIILTICISPNLLQRSEMPVVGSTWNDNDVISPYQFEAPDTDAAKAAQQRLEEAHEKVFTYNTALEAQAGRDVDRLLHIMQEGDKASSLSVPTRLRTEAGISLSSDTLQTLARVAGHGRTGSDLKTIFHNLYSVRGVSSDKILYEGALRARRAVVLLPGSMKVTTPSLQGVLQYPGDAFTYLESRYLPSFGVPKDVQAAYADVVRQLLRPNLTHDVVLTQNRHAANLESVDPVRVIQPGQRIIARGEKVTSFHGTALERLDREEQYYNLLRALGGLVMVILAMIFTAIYAQRFNSALGFSSRSVLLVALPVVIAVSLGRFILNLGGGVVLGAFAFPAGMVGILCVILFDSRFALVLVTLSCALFSVATGLLYPYGMVGLVGGFTAVAGLSAFKERREVLLTGLYIAATNCMAALAVGLILNPAAPEFQPSLVAGLANGVVCYMLAVAALPFFEHLFQITTDVRLMELTSAQHPLLQEMEQKAPGSYQHSLNVALLAEAAAEAVGAQYLLVRAGAYFHDVGKMVKPRYYTENQTTTEEKKIHSRLSPHMSTLIIKNHVKDGIELARKHQLPQKVADFVPQHHGTTLIKYFYVQALKRAEAEGLDEIVHENEFRYPGPKPQNIETAIVMLADTVDATSTAQFRNMIPDEDDIRKLVRDSIRDKFDDGQFDECPMTLRDLHLITEAFVKSLLNRRHERVDYPEVPVRETIRSGQPEAVEAR